MTVHELRAKIYGAENLPGHTILHYARFGLHSRRCLALILEGVSTRVGYLRIRRVSVKLSLASNFATNLPTTLFEMNGTEIQDVLSKHRFQLGAELHDQDP